MIKQLRREANDILAAWGLSKAERAAVRLVICVGSVGTRIPGLRIEVTDRAALRAHLAEVNRSAKGGAR